jgi:acetoin utilization deacetylase AcuC-like enzyme
VRQIHVPMPIYYNDHYVAPRVEFETFRKAQHIAAKVLDDRAFQLTDPAQRPDAIARATEEVMRFTDTEYLNAIVTGSPKSLAASNGLGWDEGFAPMVFNSTAGILSAIDDVTKGSNCVAASLSSGLHHATARCGSGFCTINSLAIGALYAAGLTESVAILDLDAHCGGGTQSFLDEHQASNVMHIDVSTQPFDTYVPGHTSSFMKIAEREHYLEEVECALDFLRERSPSLVLYNAGVDVYPTVERDIVLERERMVNTIMSDLGSRCVIVMAGGYGDFEFVSSMHFDTLKTFSSSE